jgi:hypothetical protein
MLPAPEREVVGRALAKGYKDRWPSCTEFVEQLGRAGAGAVSTAAGDSTPGALSRPRVPPSSGPVA